ncbi:hypothetical protein ANN_01961, partial [Periplaneta americana]
MGRCTISAKEHRNIDNIKTNKFVLTHGSVVDIQVRGFADASEKAYGAKNELRELHQLLKSTEGTKELEEFNWHFIPPNSPHFVGLWEAEVKSMKHHLRRVIGANYLTYDELHTIICQVEAVLNSRPIMSVSNDPDDPSYLSPGGWYVWDFKVGNSASYVNIYFEGCRRHVLRARLPSEPQESCEEMHHLYLSTLLDLTSEAMVHALGVLLKWLDVSWTFLQLEQHNAAATIMTFTNFSLADMVMINSVTYEALQIFNKVAHPSSFKRGVPGSYKEGLSVYSIFNRCKSQLGSKCM